MGGPSESRTTGTGRRIIIPPQVEREIQAETDARARFEKEVAEALALHHQAIMMERRAKVSGVLNRKSLLRYVHRYAAAMVVAVWRTFTRGGPC